MLLLVLIMQELRLFQVQNIVYKCTASLYIMRKVYVSIDILLLGLMVDLY